MQIDVLLRQTYRSSTLDNDALRDYVKAIQADALKTIYATLSPRPASPVPNNLESG
jgi:hypothetical protein